MNGVTAPLRKTPCFFCHVKLQGKDGHLWPSLTESASTLILGFQNGEKQTSIVDKLLNLWYFVIAAQMDKDIDHEQCHSNSRTQPTSEL